MSNINPKIKTTKIRASKVSSKQPEAQTANQPKIMAKSAAKATATAQLKQSSQTTKATTKATATNAKTTTVTAAKLKTQDAENLNDFVFPELKYSAKNLVFNKTTKYFSRISLIVLCGAIIMYIPLLRILLLLLNLIYIIIFVPKLLYYLFGVLQNFLQPKPNLQELDSATLPVYTILLPMYHERDTLSYLIHSIEQFDYPKELLDVKIILEADDQITQSTIADLTIPFPHETIIVPKGVVQTKPRACNYALRRATGEYLVIYDAEDRPEPDQLKQAIYQFRHSSDKVMCLQARLNFYNYHDNWLTKMFALEYALWFDSILPGLSISESLILLGGTSNHFRTDLLREIGAWDSYNVTEDADLGVRISRAGYLVKSLNSHTWEEAPNSFSAWLKQRTRWIKGYIQTYLVHIRQPYKLAKELGIKDFVNFHLFLGGPVVVFIFAPFVLLVNNIIYWNLSTAIPVEYIALSMFNSWFTFITLVIMNIVIVLHYRWSHMLLNIFTMPFYYFLHMLAGFLALQEFISAPFRWNKTTHGLSYDLQADKILQLAKQLEKRTAFEERQTSK